MTDLRKLAIQKLVISVSETTSANVMVIALSLKITIFTPMALIMGKSERCQITRYKIIFHGASISNITIHVFDY